MKIEDTQLRNKFKRYVVYVEETKEVLEEFRQKNTAKDFMQRQQLIYYPYILKMKVKYLK